MVIHSTKKDNYIIAPIDCEMQQEVIVRTHYFIELGSKLLKKKFSFIPVIFDLSGKVAGMYKWKKLSTKTSDDLGVIRYNPWIFAKYYKENFTTTIPHEVAHYLARCLHADHKLRPHGLEWRSIMHAFEANNNVTASFDMSGIPCRKSKKFRYLCDCMTHYLGTLRHNKCSRHQAEYLCRLCHTKLVFTSGSGCD